MNFALSEEQQMLQESARRFFAERHPLALARRALPWSDAVQQAIWQDMAAMGWLGLLAGEAHGGMELGMCEAVLVAEAAGRQLLNLPFAASAVMLPLLLKTSAQSSATLVDWVREAVAGQAAFNISLAGQLCMDHDQQCSHQLLVHGLDGAAAVVVTQLADEATEPRHAARSLALDPTLRIAALGQQKQQPEKMALQISGEDAAHLLACYRLARIGEMLGAAAAALDMSCDYARSREQFGQPIGSYQGVKHQLSDAWMALDNARLCTLYAAAALDEKRSDWRFACAAAELGAIEGGLQTGRLGIQVHGGLGFSWEHDAHLYLKRIHHVAALLGGIDAACETLEAMV